MIHRVDFTKDGPQERWFSEIHGELKRDPNSCDVFVRVRDGKAIHRHEGRLHETTSPNFMGGEMCEECF